MELTRMRINVLELIITLAVVGGSKVGGEVDKGPPCDLRLAGIAGAIKVAQSQRKKPADRDHRTLSVIEIETHLAEKPHAVMVEVGVTQKAQNLPRRLKTAE